MVVYISSSTHCMILYFKQYVLYTINFGKSSSSAAIVKVHWLIKSDGQCCKIFGHPILQIDSKSLDFYSTSSVSVTHFV